MEFRVLGPLQVVADGRELNVGGQRHQRLLAALLLEANRVVGHGRLAEAVWDGDAPTTQRRQIQNLVGALRAVLAGAGGVIETHDAGYRLRVGPDDLDATVFDRLVADGRAAGARDERAQAIRLLRQALALWRGPALAGLDSAPLRTRATGLEERRLAALADCIDLELAYGDHRTVVAQLSDLVAEYPLQERFAGQLMVALYRDGRRSEALAAYRALADRLAEELGIDPTPEIRRLHEAVLREDQSLGAADPARTVAPATASSAATLPRPAQLPTDTTAFTGRTTHLDQLGGIFAAGQAENAVVISAIAGTAGVGKTALAVHWAHRIRDKFPDGQLYVNLRGYSPTPPLRPIDALAGFLRALGVPPEQVPTGVDEAAAMYRSRLANHQVLILLDNAASVEQVRPLLPGSAGCLVVITSRDALNGLVAREGARRVALGVLTPDEAGTLLTRLLGDDRVAAEPHTAAELADLCGRLPLAMRIASAHIAEGHRIGDHVARLRQGNRLSALEVDGDPTMAVRGAFDLSYAALSAPAQRLFRLLALIPGGDFSAAAAAALAGIPPNEVGPLLGRLVAAHLIEWPAPDRYALHDLLRLYAAERGAEDDDRDRSGAADRLYRWYLTSIGAAALLLYPQMGRLPPDETAQPAAAVAFTGEADALAWLEAERANLVAAVRHSAEHGPRGYAWRLCDALRGYFWLRRYAVDWLTVAESALAAAVAEGAVQGQAAVELNLANLDWSLGRPRSAVDHYKLALPLTRQTGWRAGESTALNNMGSLFTELGMLEDAIEHLRAALAIDEELGWHAGVATRLSNLGVVYEQMGRLAEAADRYTEALDRYRDIGSRDGRAQCLHHLGVAHGELGRLDLASAELTEAIGDYRVIGNRYAEAYALAALAAVQGDAHRLDEAIATGEEALTLSREIGDRRAEAMALSALGNAELNGGREREAADRQRQALALSRAIDDRFGEVAALTGLAAALSGAGEPPEALDVARQAVSAARKTRYRVLECYALTTLAEIHLSAGQRDDAEQVATEALAGCRETGQRLGLARALVALGRARQPVDEAAAVGHWQEALDILDEIGTPEADQVRARLTAA